MNMEYFNYKPIYYIKAHLIIKKKKKTEEVPIVRKGFRMALPHKDWLCKIIMVWKRSQDKYRTKETRKKIDNHTNTKDLRGSAIAYIHR